jgi:hypothetical protein
VNRTRAWLVVSPVIAAGVLAGHGLAYRVTSTPTGPVHEYLAHAPQVLLILALSGLALAGFGQRRAAPPTWAFPAVAVTTFVAQEHVERVVHGAQVPILLAEPVFLVGLALQIPVALVAWALARRLLAVVAEDDSHVRLRPRLELDVCTVELDQLAAIALPTPLSRGPPARVTSR